ncbi:MAG TPA: tRNA glutamyl-Q(34) synthetase GluQRS [Aestuariivirga sp.]|nr:tRNA glutamyl-Q(34) synthetase GluQRS [Aestuariivirga sp.]
MRHPRPVFRFAPSPNGRLHLGHAYSALLNQHLAKAAGGHFLLRIEDIDQTRCTRGLGEAAMEDLRWLGLRWDGAVRWQSEHLTDYHAAQARLTALGLTYPCTCSRKELSARPGTAIDPEGQPLYPGTCRTRGARPGLPASLRLDMAWAAAGRHLTMHEDEAEKPVDPCAWGDVIIARKDIGTSYHVAVSVDDALQGVTHVVRGLDLRAATAIHRLVQDVLCLPVPRYHHHALIRHGTGRKLAKSQGDQSLADLRAQGLSAADIRASLGFS